MMEGTRNEAGGLWRYNVRLDHKPRGRGLCTVYSRKSYATDTLQGWYILDDRMVASQSNLFYSYIVH